MRHRTRAEAAEELAERLAAAVAARLPPAGETGLTLSGGLDSCSVAAAAADTLAARGKALHAFTWSSSQGDGIDERAVSSALIASRRNIVEHPVLADSLWPLGRHPDAWTDRNSPETNAYPDLLLATVETALGNGVKALLNGLGGAPVTGWLTPDLSLLLRGRWLTLARRIGETGIRGSGFVRQWRLAFGRRSLPQWLTAQGKTVALAAGLDAPAVPLSALLSPRGSRRRAISGPSNAAALERLDRLSRRLGLRMAAPWYDARLAALVLSLSDAAFSAALPMKGLLREAMVGHLPEAVRCATTVKETDSRLDRKGYLDGGRPVIEALLTRSRLADLGLVDADGIAAVYRRSVESGLIMPRLQTIVASECCLRTHESSILNFGDR